MEEVIKIKIDSLIDSPYQGRLISIMDHSGKVLQYGLRQLSESIRSNGLLQPISVREKDGNYEVIDGHRRVEAHKILGLTEIKALVNNVSDKEAQVISVISNIQRENLSNIERAIAFRKILDQSIFKDKRELSKAIGKDETYVGDLLNVLNMDKRIIEDVATNKTTNDVRLLRAIRKVEDVNLSGESEKQWELYNRFKKENLSRKEISKIVLKIKRPDLGQYEIKGEHKKLSIIMHEKLTRKQEILFKQILEEKIKQILQEI